MKNILHFTIILFLVVLYSNTQAQNFEGQIKMKMELQDAPPELDAMKSMFESTITVDVKNEKSRTTMSNAVTGNMVIISDPKKNEVTLLMDMMGEKTAVVYGMNEYKSEKNGEVETNLKTKKTGETKSIAGHKCEKVIATITTTDGSAEMEVWCALDIQNVNTEMSDYPGMPLEYTILTEGLKMHFITTEIANKKIEDSIFSIPSDYKIKTDEEFEKSFGGKH
jgi:hypothetical protein